MLLVNLLLLPLLLYYSILSCPLLHSLSFSLSTFQIRTKLFCFVLTSQTNSLQWHIIARLSNHSFILLPSKPLAFPFYLPPKMLFHLISSHLAPSRLVPSRPFFSTLLLTFSISTIQPLVSTTLDFGRQLWSNVIVIVIAKRVSSGKMRLHCGAIKVQSQQKWLQSVVVEAEA